jgi:tetratricopeptide (TPR) repeat protein
MVRNIFLLVMLIGVSLNGFAEDYSNLKKSRKIEILDSVYNRIANALGDVRLRPKLYFNDKEPVRMAFFRNRSNGFPEIGFDEAAFDVCMTMGDRKFDALAYLLAHEIGHYKMEHSWGDEFKSSFGFSFLDETEELNAETVKTHETQADVEGGILCYLAGFSTKGIGEELLNKLYDKYKMNKSDDPNSNYPSLNDRIRITVKRDIQVQEYIDVYETGNYAMLVGDHKLAINCYEFVIGKGFHSKEIYNNLGVLHYLKGKSETEDSKLKYFYPVQMDFSLSTRGQGATKGGEAHFEEALKMFEKATQFDEGYATGYLNMACMSSILGDLELAKGYAKKAIKKGKKDELIVKHAQLVLVILEHERLELNEDGLSGKQIKKGTKKNFAKLDKLIGHEKDVFAKNYQVLELGKKFDYKKFNPSTVSKQQEDDDGSLEFVHDLNITTRKKLTFSSDQAAKKDVDIENGISIQTFTFHDAKLYQFLGTSKKKNKLYRFHKAESNYSGSTTKKVKIKSTRSFVEQQYGAPTLELSTTTGSLLCYKWKKIVFFINEKGEVTEWMVWHSLTK